MSTQCGSARCKKLEAHLQHLPAWQRTQGSSTMPGGVASGPPLSCWLGRAVHLVLLEGTDRDGLYAMVCVVLQGALPAGTLEMAPQNASTAPSGLTVREVCTRIPTTPGRSGAPAT